MKNVFKCDIGWFSSSVLASVRRQELSPKRATKNEEEADTQFCAFPQEVRNREENIKYTQSEDAAAARCVDILKIGIFFCVSSNEKFLF